MENSVEKTTDQIVHELMQEAQEVIAKTKESGIVFKKVRDRKSSLDLLLKTPEQAKRLMILMNAAKDGLI